MFRIIDIAREISSGITPLRSNSEYWDNGTIPWLKTEQIGEYRIKTTNEFVTEKALESTGLKLYPKNTISIAMYGEGKTRGNVSIIDCPMTTNQACCNIVVNESIVAPFYLYYFFKTQYHNLRQLSSGVRKNLNSNDIKNYLINLPNKITQQNIVNFLCSIDEKIELNNKINLELEKVAKTLYEYWFVQFDFPDENERPYKSSGGAMVYNEVLKREIPVGWRVKELQNIASISNEQITPNECVAYRHYSIPAFDEKGTYIIESGEDIHSNKFIIKSFDVLISKLNPRFSRVICADNEEDMVSSTELIVFRCNDEQNQSLVYCIAKSDNFYSYCVKNATGSSGSHNRINHEIMGAYKIPYNHSTYELFKSRISDIIQKRNHIIKENQKLISIKDFLLPMLMNGQISIATTE